MAHGYKTTAERVLAGRVSPEAVETVLREEHAAVVRPARKAAEPSVRCDYCSRGVRGQARKRALHFGGSVFCSRCEREKRQG